MLTTVLLVILVLALGTHLADGLRVRQEEVILKKLPLGEAHAYYELLKKRVVRVRVLRAVTLVSLALTLLAARRRFFPAPYDRGKVAADRTAAAALAPPTNTDAARAVSDRAVKAYVAQTGLDIKKFAATGVSGDDQWPWIFDYSEQAVVSPVRLRVYVSVDGKTQVRRVTRP